MSSMGEKEGDGRKLFSSSIKPGRSMRGPLRQKSD